MKAVERQRQADIKYDISWTTLGEYLDYMEKRGVTPNLASFVGATTVRIHELGEGDVDPTPEQLQRMGSPLLPGWAAAVGSEASIDSSLPRSTFAFSSSGFFRASASSSGSGGAEWTAGGTWSF